MTKPRLTLIGTGGTIAGAASAASVSTNCQPASLSMAAVVDTTAGTVPALRQRSQPAHAVGQLRRAARALA